MELKKNNILCFNYAIFGYPVSHSLSPVLMKYFCDLFNKNRKKFNFNWNILFNCFRINDINLFNSSFINDISLDFCNFTTPYKLKDNYYEVGFENNLETNDKILMTCFDNYNTFSNLINKKINTDYLGIYYSIKEILETEKRVNNKTKGIFDYIIIIGKGHTAFSAIKALNIVGVKEINIFYKNKDDNRLNLIKNSFHKLKLNFLSINEISNYINSEISINECNILFINTSDQDIIDLYHLELVIYNLLDKNKKINLYIVDLSYSKTPLYKWVNYFKKSNIKYISPISIFFYQGFFSYLFFINSFFISEHGLEIGKKFIKNFNIFFLLNREEIKNKFLINLKRFIRKEYKRNISFIGFSYSGKSEILKKFKDLKNKNEKDLIFINSLYDLDKFIEDNLNITVYKLFEKGGEKNFRNLEYQFLKRLLKIISTKHKNKMLNLISMGGGVLENEKTSKILKYRFYNMYIYIKDFDTIYKRFLFDKYKERPLFKQNYNKIKELFYKRKKIYLEFANLLINGNDLEFNNELLHVGENEIEKRISNLYEMVKSEAINLYNFLINFNI
ncbi:MAG: hypothetical protein N3A58_00640 [Spirochaetes bacterium]|nr:hypothetical protein [Spirochaetota bacterium]